MYNTDVKIERSKDKTSQSKLKFGWLPSPVKGTNIMKKNTFSINHENKTITLTKAYAQRANTPGTKEFRELATLHKTYGDYDIIMRTATQSSDKETHKGLSINQMERHIKVFYGKEALEAFQTVKEYHKDTKGYYGKVKAWFLKHYPNYQEIDFSQMVAEQNTDSQKPENQVPADLALAG